MPQKQQILIQAAQMFLKFGFKSITMDDISRELGLSKKTVYQHFTDKTDLVEQCVDNHLANMQQCCITCREQADNAIDQMINLTNMLTENMRQVNPSAMFDLKKYFKTAWDNLEKHRNEFIYQNIKQNLIQGKKEGLYYKNLDANTVSIFYIHLVELLTNPDKFTQDISYAHMLKELVKYHMRSICNQKGLELLNIKLKELK